MKKKKREREICHYCILASGTRFLVLKGMKIGQVMPLDELLARPCCIISLHFHFTTVTDPVYLFSSCPSVNTVTKYFLFDCEAENY